MRDESVDYKDLCEMLEKHLEAARKDYDMRRKAMEVLIAIGHVSREKAEQALKLVATFS